MAETILQLPDSHGNHGINPLCGHIFSCCGHIVKLPYRRDPEASSPIDILGVQELASIDALPSLALKASTTQLHRSSFLAITIPRYSPPMRSSCSFAAGPWKLPYDFGAMSTPPSYMRTSPSPFTSGVPYALNQLGSTYVGCCLCCFERSGTWANRQMPASSYEGGQFRPPGGKEGSLEGF